MQRLGKAAFLFVSLGLDSIKLRVMILDEFEMAKKGQRGGEKFFGVESVAVKEFYYPQSSEL